MFRYLSEPFKKFCKVYTLTGHLLAVSQTGAVKNHESCL